MSQSPPSLGVSPAKSYAPAKPSGRMRLVYKLHSLSCRHALVLDAAIQIPLLTMCSFPSGFVQQMGQSVTLVHL